MTDFSGRVGSRTVVTGASPTPTRPSLLAGERVTPRSVPRTLSHFDDLLNLLQLERSEQRSRLEELRETLPLAELESRGLVLLNLEVTDDAVGLGGRFLLTFAREDRRWLPRRLDVGELVEVRPRRTEEVEPARGVVSRAARHELQVAFDRSPPQWIGEGLLRLDLVPNDVTFDRATSAVRRVRGWEKGKERDRREVLLGNAEARFERPPKLTPVRPLNPEQQDAVARALAAEDFFLVHGPPGTGKSTVLSEVARHAAASGARILATAASNAAVDHLLELCLEQGIPSIRVGHPARVLPHLAEHTLDLKVEDHPDRQVSRELFEEAYSLFGYANRQRKQGRSRERFSNARASSSEAKQLLDEARALEKKAIRAVLSRAQVVCATLSSLDSNVIAGEEFDLALVDEATQAIEPLTLIAFLRAPKVILAGDHKQLPPTVLSPQAARRGLSRSLFERLLEDHGEGVKRMLAEQYRMHQQIMSFPSREMYGGGLRAHPSVAERLLTEVLTPGAQLDAPPVLFLDTAGKGFEDEKAQSSDSRLNPGEAALVAQRARELLGLGLDPAELAIIAPYSAQAAHLRELVDDPRVEIDTVDAFQGREKDAVLLSLTRSNAEGAIGFLSDLRRMNVAITRPRRHLFVVGDSATLGGEPFYARFIETTQAEGGYRSAWEWPEPAEG